MNYYCIYIITNLLNGKQYIGQTTRKLQQRWKEHISDAKQGTLYPISKAIRKYGPENFQIKEMVQVNSIEELNEMETKAIKIFNTLVPNGYNLCSGGGNRLMHSDTKKKISDGNKGVLRPKSPEHRAKISDSLKGRPSPRKGLPGRKMPPRTAEHRHNLSIAHMGKKQSDEHRVNGANARRGNKNAAGKRSDEFSKKMSDIKKGVPWTQARRGAGKKV